MEVDVMEEVLEKMAAIFKVFLILLCLSYFTLFGLEFRF